MRKRIEPIRPTSKISPFAGKHLKTRVTILGFLCLCVFVLSFSIGRYSVPPLEVVKILLNRLFGWLIPIEQTWSDQMAIVVLNVRLPRIIAAALVGAALAVAGSIYQGMFKNPLVSPDILGSSAGAGFGAALGILLSFGALGVSASAFFFGIIAVFVAVFAASRYKNNPTLGLVLAGIMIGSLFQAGVSFIKLVADPTEQLPAITYWLMGSLANVRITDLWLLIPVVLMGLAPLFLLRWRMNVLTLGEEEARSLGINTKALRITVILCATLITAGSVAVSGMIGWVGLVIPHLSRKMVGCDYKYLMPASLLMGAGFLILVDNLSRTITTSEVPIGILTAFVGAPFFLYLIMKGDKK